MARHLIRTTILGVLLARVGVTADQTYAMHVLWQLVGLNRWLSITTHLILHIEP